MSALHRFAALVFLLPALALADASAPKASPQIASPTFQACGKDEDAFHADLLRLKGELEHWAAAQSPKALASPELDHSREGRLLLLYGAYLLPKGAPFADWFQDCWAYYVDFERAMGNHREAEVRAGFKGWKACVTNHFDEVPPEAKDLVSCWGKTRR